MRETLLCQLILLFIATTTTICAPTTTTTTSIFTSATSDVLCPHEDGCEYGKILSILRDFRIQFLGTSTTTNTSVTSTTTTISRTTTTTTTSRTTTTTSTSKSTTTTTLCATITSTSYPPPFEYTPIRNFINLKAERDYGVLGPPADKCEDGMIWSTFINKCVEDFNMS